jgi:inhibitor of KinA sporulation pathway (predicted exonuclease)
VTLWIGRWINLKIPHRQIYGNVKANFKQSVELMGRKFEGRPHSGLDDAKNTAYLALELIQRGIRLRVTGCLKGHVLDEASKVAPPWSKKRKNPAFTPR